MSAEFYAAMAAAFAEMPDIPKTRVNPQFRSKYMNFDDIANAVRPVLAKHGLYFRQAPEGLDDPNFVACRTFIGHRSGVEIDAGVAIVPARPLAKRGEEPPPVNAHSYGSGYTFARRYGLSAALSISEGEDDDGNAAASNGNGHGRPVKKAATNGAADFFKAVVNKSGMDDADARQLAGDVARMLGLDKATATGDQWAKAIATVNNKDDLVAWVSGGGA